MLDEAISFFATPTTTTATTTTTTTTQIKLTIGRRSESKKILIDMEEGVTVDFEAIYRNDKILFNLNKNYFAKLLLLILLCLYSKKLRGVDP